MENLSGLTPEEKAEALKAIRRFQDQETGKSDVSSDNVGTSNGEVKVLRKNDRFVGLSYSQIKRHFQSIIEEQKIQRQGGES